MARQRYIVTGKVQKIGFRYWTHHIASAYGLRGWVRNLPDGTVEVVAEGDLSTLRQFEEELWHGPVSGEITNVEPCETDLEEPLSEFTIR